MTSTSICLGRQSRAHGAGRPCYASRPWKPDVQDPGVRRAGLGGGGGALLVMDDTSLLETDRQTDGGERQAERKGETERETEGEAGRDGETETGRERAS